MIMILAILKLVWPILMVIVLMGVWGILDIIRAGNRTKNLNNKIWIGIIVALPVLGPLVYFLVGEYPNT